MGCHQNLFLHPITTNWCCLSCLGSRMRWTLPSTCARCCPTRANMPCSLRKIPNSSRCCWRMRAYLMTVRLFSMYTSPLYHCVCERLYLVCLSRSVRKLFCCVWNRLAGENFTRLCKGTKILLNRRCFQTHLLL